MSTASEARQALVDLTTLTRRELFDLWQQLAEIRDNRTLRDLLLDVLPAIGEEYGSAAAALAADWYDDLRVEAGAAGRFLAEPHPLPDLGRYEALVGWALDPLYQSAPDRDAAFVLLEGGMQRTVADQHRLTVVESTQRDPRAKGWRRIGVGANCRLCNKLIARGAVYTDETVTFRTHDHCNCAASPTWDDNVVKVSTDAYRASKRRQSDADRARLKAWLAEDD